MSVATMTNERRVAGEPKPFRFDLPLIIVTLLLLGFGIVFVTSASIALAEKDLGNPFYYGERQVIYAAMGLAAALVMMALPLNLWRKLSPALLLAGFALLTLVLVPGFGREVNGAVRWLTIGPVRLIQASEPARLCFFIFIADYIARRNTELSTTFTGFAKPMGLMALAGILLLAEPDFGAATVLIATVLGMLFIGGARLRDFLALVVAAFAALAALAVSSPYRLERLTTFLDPWSDPFNSGFQLTQSLIAIGRGEWFGVGLGSGVQKLFYLPEAHTDFVFAVIAEELGLFGVVLLLGLYIIFFMRCFAIARMAARAEQHFGAYLAFGIGIWIGMQAMINLGVNMGVLPTKGLTLPLVSSGGSSLLIVSAAIGLLLRIGFEANQSSTAIWRRKETAA
ncbi:MAG: putative lipid II flippase FtsW [Gammaproteobacteria bacterium]|nr:putative lipid II flippase FtsW [Gammaproteobacteria bacterium]